MIWPKLPGTKDAPMTLRGGPEDSRHIQTFLKLIAPGLRAESIENARRKDIQDHIKKLVDTCLSLLVAYFQGHGENISNGKDEDYSVRYITGDAKNDGSLEYLTAEEFIEMFSAFSARTMLVAITDICHSGNLYRLRFQLLVSKDGTAFWCETEEWNDDNKLGRKHKINAPMIHIAGSHRWQQVYETKSTGGYFTHSLGSFKDASMTLPQFLLDLQCVYGCFWIIVTLIYFIFRESVNRHLDKAKAHPRKPLDPWVEQVPQMFSNHMWPLDEPGILSKICLGTT